MTGSISTEKGTTIIDLSFTKYPYYHRNITYELNEEKNSITVTALKANWIHIQDIEWSSDTARYRNDLNPYHETDKVQEEYLEDYEFKIHWFNRPVSHIFGDGIRKGKRIKVGWAELKDSNEPVVFTTTNFKLILPNARQRVK